MTTRTAVSLLVRAGKGTPRPRARVSHLPPTPRASTSIPVHRLSCWSGPTASPTLPSRRRCRFSSSASAADTSAIETTTDVSRLEEATTKTVKQPRIAVALSGGVDSSVAAHLLCSKYPSADVVGLHMTNWDVDDEIDGREEKNSDRGGVLQKQGSHLRRKRRRQAEATDSKGSGGKKGGVCRETLENDAADARSVADHLSVPFRRASFASEYWTDVFQPFVEGISDGYTPNPDVGCNRWVKFGAMREFCLRGGDDGDTDDVDGNAGVGVGSGGLGATYVATGHYARLWHRDDGTSLGCDPVLEGENAGMAAAVEEATADRPEGEWIKSWGYSDGTAGGLNPLLLAGADLSKDQSYFLSGVPGHAFRNVLFPLGNLVKKKQESNRSAATDVDDQEEDNVYAAVAKAEAVTVRDIAEQAGLPNASKRESMGICFVGRRDFGDFISGYLPGKGDGGNNEGGATRGGNFVDVDTGEIVGRHSGSAHYTVGQGAKIPGASQKWFVVGRQGGGRRWPVDDDDIGHVSLDNDDDDVLVCGGTKHPALYANELSVRAAEFNWIGGAVPPPLRASTAAAIASDANGSAGGVGGSMRALCRTRHLQRLAPCTVHWDCNTDNIAIRFDYPLRAIAPGQTAALYVGKGGLICLGGGPILDRGPSYHERGLDVPLLG